MAIITKAKIYATRAHEEISQTRKYTNSPYIIHPAAVAARVAKVTKSKNLVAAAWLHDTVEDTNATIEDIRKNFGPEIEALVESLTDISKATDGNRKLRKDIDRKHTEAASPGAKTVKLADLIDNSVSIIKYGRDFAFVYMEEMSQMLEILKEGDSRLFKEAVTIVDDFRKSKH
ncbi:MAG: hypothetical protein COA79_04480 [Planctomycetota bacterium]|nr:MAG: hypothetical protein COA79_04480 [Planctomycetota bacterium]